MNQKWQAEEYTKSFSFVYQYGEDVLSLIDLPKGSFCLDLGCGNGALTRRLQEQGYRVLGLDASGEMVSKAAADYPDLTFRQADARTFLLEEAADCIFSNAVFHWIDEAGSWSASSAARAIPGPSWPSWAGSWPSRGWNTVMVSIFRLWAIMPPCWKKRAFRCARPGCSGGPPPLPVEKRGCGTGCGCLPGNSLADWSRPGRSRCWPGWRQFFAPICGTRKKAAGWPTMCGCGCRLCGKIEKGGSARKRPAFFI